MVPNITELRITEMRAVTTRVVDDGLIVVYRGSTYTTIE